MPYTFTPDPAGKDVVKGVNGTVKTYDDLVAICGGEVFSTDPRDSEIFDISKLKLIDGLPEPLYDYLFEFLEKPENIKIQRRFINAQTLSNVDPMVLDVCALLQTRFELSANDVKQMLVAARV
jgi:hypothetical protein